jgi:esterase/lipase superfamily enzyme
MWTATNCFHLCPGTDGVVRQRHVNVCSQLNFVRLQFPFGSDACNYVRAPSHYSGSQRVLLVRPTNFLVPTGQQYPDTSRVDILAATTRQAEGAQPGEFYTGERAIGLHFAHIAVSVPPAGGRKSGDVQWPENGGGNPAKEFTTISAERLDKEQALNRFYASLRKTPHRSVLLFVHGYNTRFEEAVYRFAQIAHDAKAPAVPLLFTWPSRGRLLAYTYDRESANYSRDSLEAVLQYLVKDKSVNDVTVLAHSMGNWVTVEALRQMSIRDKGIHPKIKTVMLAAPDIDVDVFRRQIAAIGNKRPPFYVFVSQDDKALAISRRVWGGNARIGAVDPEQEPFRSMFAKENIKVFDLTKEKSDDTLNHGKFANSSDVAKIIAGQLASGQTLSDSRAGLGDTIGIITTGAASAVGRAASIAVSTPVAIIDPRTREGLGDQFDDLNRHIKHAVGASNLTSQQ